MKTKVGKWGEIHAARYLRENSYDIFDANYSCRFGEIDIIANDSKYLIFVEVKSRTNISLGEPREYVDCKKQRKIIMSALLYCKTVGFDGPIRFDVVEVYFHKDNYTEPYKINHITNAFDAEDIKMYL